MAKFKEKYTEAIVCPQLGSFVNGTAAHREICDAAVEIVKGKVYVPEDVAFPDTVVSTVAEDTGVVSVTVGFDLAPEADGIKLTYPEEVLEVSDPAVAGTDVTFTVTPKDGASFNTFSTVKFDYLGYTKIIPVNCLEPATAEPIVPPTPAPEPGDEAEITSVTASPESIAVGEDSTITINFSKAPVSEPTLEVDDKVTIKTALAVNGTSATAVVTGAVAGTASITVRLGNGLSPATITVTA